MATRQRRTLVSRRRGALNIDLASGGADNGSRTLVEVDSDGTGISSEVKLPCRITFSLILFLPLGEIGQLDRLRRIVCRAASRIVATPDRANSTQ